MVETKNMQHDENAKYTVNNAYRNLHYYLSSYTK